MIKKAVPAGPEADGNMVVDVPVLRCVRLVRPTAADIVGLLNRSAAGAEQIAAWAGTPVGEALAGTTFVVTERRDGPE